VNGRFLMSKYSNDGHKLNHEILSTCTKELVRKNLASSTRTGCLSKAEAAFCGDGVVQDGEDCDCGTILQCVASRSCCVPPEGAGTRSPCTWQSDVQACVR
jgi:disintegrin and metalloproteinase domain-containing protein 10